MVDNVSFSSILVGCSQNMSLPFIELRNSSIHIVFDLFLLVSVTAAIKIKLYGIVSVETEYIFLNFKQSQQTGLVRQLVFKVSSVYQSSAGKYNFVVC